MPTQPRVPTGTTQTAAPRTATSLAAAQAYRSATPAPTPPAPTTQDQKSAKAIITDALAQYGLPALGTWAWTEYLNGNPVEQILLNLRDRPEYKTRFAGLDELRKKGRGISEAQWINYEQSAASLMRARGLPEGFYDSPDDFAKFITNEVSLKELDDRLNLAQQAAFSAPPEVRAELARLYNVGPGELTAFWIDPDKALPLLERKYTSAQLAAESSRTGFGSLTGTQAERLSSLGVDPNQSAGTFRTLAGMKELTSNFAGETGTIDQQTLLDAGFGNDATATQAVEKRARRRKAEFEAGGTFASGQTGVTGLGSANT